jgi:phage N-6-adenine-methyltransferase
VESILRGEIVDTDAIRIGESYRKAKLSIIDSVKYQIECGRALTEKKNSLSHGEWLPWLEANQGTLKFESRQTASRLMKLASNGAATHHLESPAQALQFSRETWGNDSTLRPLSGTGENEWYTPTKCIDMTRRVLGEIDLDPASSEVAQETVRAKEWFSKQDDGLQQKWRGRVWMNPPYSYPLIEQFIVKLLDELSADRVAEAIALTNSMTETAWFHRAAGIARAVCFTRGRLRFFRYTEGDRTNPPCGSAFFYFGENADKFADVFKEIGFIT